MSEKQLKILIPILSFGRAGGIRVLSQLANYWKREGHTVTLVSFHESENPYYPVSAKIIWIDNKGNEIENNSLIYKLNNSGIKRMIALYRFLKNNSKDYDIVLANSNKSTWPVWIGSKSKNYYYIQAYEVEFNSAKNIKGLLSRFISWLTYFLPLHKIVNADIYKNYKNIRSNYMIPPGIELGIYYPKNLLEDCKEEFVVGCIGRKETWKGSEDVAEAVKILHDIGYRIKFKVAFNQVEYSQHELVFPDGDSNLADFYRSLDVLVAPGHIQLGAVHYPVIEAMACNVPVITTGYYPANEQNSFIVPIKSPKKIADKIELIINDYSIAICKAKLASDNINEFDWEVVSAKFLNIFTKK